MEQFKYGVKIAMGFLAIVAVAVGVVAAFAGVLQLAFPAQVREIREKLVMAPTGTPMPTQTPYPTPAPYPTPTPYPTNTPYPAPSPAEVMVVATPTPFATTPPGFLFFDDFDAGAHPDWEILVGDFVVANGAYTPKGTSISDSAIAVVGHPEWRNYTVEIDVSSFDSRSDAYILVRVQDTDNLVAFWLNYYECGWRVRKDGEWEDVPNTKMRADIVRDYDFHPLRVTVEGNKYEAYANGSKVSYFVDAIFPTGKVGVYLFHPVAVDNLRVSGLGGE